MFYSMDYKVLTVCKLPDTKIFWFVLQLLYYIFLAFIYGILFIVANANLRKVAFGGYNSDFLLFKAVYRYSLYSYSLFGIQCNKECNIKNFVAKLISNIFVSLEYLNSIH